MSAALVARIDISGWASSWATEEAIARELDAAASDVGFFQIAGHGVDEAVISDLRIAMASLFALAMEEKPALRPSLASLNRGDAPPKSESESLAYSLGVSSPSDLFEAFNFGPDVEGLSSAASTRPWSPTSPS